MRSVSPAFLYILGLALACIVGCQMLDPNPGPAPVTGETSGTGPGGGVIAPPADTTLPTVERGAALYAQYCARCHGDSAEGTKIWPTPLQGRTGIHDIVRSGRRAMPPEPNLSDSGIASIELFLGTFHSDFDNKSPYQLYVTYCASCHGDSALGTKIYPGSIQGCDTIYNIVRNGRREMLAVNVPDSIIAKIQQFVSSLKVDLTKVGGVEFYSRECAKCHGADGEGTTRGYEIRNPVTGYATYVIRNGRPGKPFANEMPAYPSAKLSTTQLNEILAMLRAKPHPGDGLSLYNRFCANCHGKDALGGMVGKNIRRELGDAMEKVRGGEGGTNYKSRTKYMPKWSTAELSDAEVNAMISYVRQLR